MALLALVALCGCESKQLELPTPNDNNPHGGSSSSYLPIEFGVDILNTRAEIIEGGEGVTLDELGVVGYQYANLTGSYWSTAKSTARPNVFRDTPHALTLADGATYYELEDGFTTDAEGKRVPTYTWSGNKYAFFAVYPLKKAGMDFMELSTATEPNTPYVVYTVDRSDEANMADIMTCARKDLTATNRYVAFHMVHRLSAVDVEVCNIYEHSWQTTEEVDGVETTTTHFENIDIEIVDLLVTFKNLHYASSKIYLDDTETFTIEGKEYVGQVPTLAADNTAQYQLIKENTDAVIAVPYKVDDDADNFQLTADKDMTMFFIPQEQNDLSVEVTVKFRKKFRDDITPAELPEDANSYKEVDGSYYIVNYNKDNTYDGEGNLTGSTNADGYGTENFYATKTTNFEQSLEERFRYYVSLNFTSAAVSINIITAAQWTDKDVNHEFE